MAAAPPGFEYASKRKRKYAPKKVTWKRKMAAPPSRREVKSMVTAAQETKWFSFNGSGFPTNATPYIVLLNGLALGTSRFARTGNRVRLTSIDLGINISAAASAVTSPSRVRVVVVVDKQADGTIITPNDMFGTGTTANLFLEMYNQNTVPSRYRVLRDTFVTLEPMTVGISTIAGGTTTTVAGSASSYYKKYRIKFKNGLQIKYSDSNTGTVADIISGAVYVVFLTDQAPAQAPIAALQYVHKWKDA